MHPRIALLPSIVCLLGLTVSAAGAPPRSDHYGDPLPDGAAFRIGTTRLRPEVKVIPPFVNVLLNSDGKYVFSSNTFARVARMWETATGRELRRFGGVFGPVDFFRDGKIIAAGGADYRIRLWDAASGRDLCPFVDPGAILQLAFSPDGRVLAANNDRGLLRLLDARTGRALKELSGYDFLAFSPDGGRVLVRPQHGDRFEPLCLLDTATGKERSRFPAGSVTDHFSGWTPDGKSLVTIGQQSVCVYDTATGQKLRELRGKGQSFDAGCSLDGRTIVITDRNDTEIRLFATDTGKELHRLTGYSPQVNYGAARGNSTVGIGGSLSPLLAPNGKLLLAGCDRNSFGLWDVTGGKRILRWNCARLLPSHPTFSPDGKWLSLVDTQGDPCLVDTATGQVRHRLAWKGGDLSFLLQIQRAFSSDGRLLAAAHDAHTLVLWETATGRPIRTWPGHGAPSRGGELQQMMFSPDGRRLATLGRDGTSLVWDVTGLAQSPARKLTAAETKQAWKDLADIDAAQAHRAIWLLVADPERALPLLREHLHPVSAADPRRLARWIADLDSNEFTVREAATRELRKVGELAQPALRAAIKDKPSLELRRRVQGLLDEMDGSDLSLESRRGLRAVAVLEHIANAEARKLLHDLAAGAAGARLTAEAKASLARLRSRHIQD